MTKTKKSRPDFRSEYIGKVFQSKSYGECIVTDYVNSDSVIIKFLETGYVTTVPSGNLRKGLVKDLMQPNVSGVGYLGVGKYVCRNKTPDGMRTPEYACWESMMRRVYNPQDEANALTYKGCTVCEEWHNFQNFAEWCQTQKGFGVQGFQIDKDILVKGNRCYSPNACCFVPKHINSAVTGIKVFNQSGYAGVEENANSNYSAGITMNSVGVHLGTFETKEKAYFIYTAIKEAYIRSLAEIYKEEIANDVYEALKIWSVNNENSSNT